MCEKSVNLKELPKKKMDKRKFISLRNFSLVPQYFPFIKILLFLVYINEKIVYKSKLVPTTSQVEIVNNPITGPTLPVY